MTRPVVDLTRSTGPQDRAMSVMVSIRTITKMGTHNLTPIALIADKKTAITFCNALNQVEPGKKGEDLALTTSRRRVSK